MLRAGLGRLGAALETGRRRRLAFHGARVALALALAALTSALFPASPAVEVPIYEVGSVAGDNVIAPFAFSIPKSEAEVDRKSTRLNSSHANISYAVFCLKKKKVIVF